MALHGDGVLLNNSLAITNKDGWRRAERRPGMMGLLVCSIGRIVLCEESSSCSGRCCIYIVGSGSEQKCCEM